MMRWGLLCAILMTTTGAASAAPPPIGGTLAAPAFWQAYRERFVSPAGRVIDNANKGISHSEGQGYGMLLAVAADDRATFDLLWGWARTQLMLRDDGLVAWKWDPETTPHVADRNNAADGDLLIAWALAEAGDRWPGSPYMLASLQLVDAIAKAGFLDTAFGPAPLPGTKGFRAEDQPDGPIVNLSYWVFPALWRFHALAPDQPWGDVAKAGIALATAARFGSAKLPSDWISLKDAPHPAQGHPPTFGYDAIRIPLYLILAGMGTKANLAPYAALWAEPSATLERVDVTNGGSLEPLRDKGYLAIAALVRCAVSSVKIPSYLTGDDVDLYYPSTLRALVLIAAHQRYPQCL
jgi:endoglucanase